MPVPGSRSLHSQIDNTRLWSFETSASSYEQGLVLASGLRLGCISRQEATCGSMLVCVAFPMIAGLYLSMSGVWPVLLFMDPSNALERLLDGPANSCFGAVQTAFDSVRSSERKMAGAKRFEEQQPSCGMRGSPGVSRIRCKR